MLSSKVYILTWVNYCWRVKDAHGIHSITSYNRALPNFNPRSEST